MDCVPVSIAVFGGLCSFSVMAEAVEKLSGAQSPTWSALKLMGPQAWSPLNGDPVRGMAAIAILVFSTFYLISCWLLDKATEKRNAYLVAPWLLCEGFTLVYQCFAALNVADRFTWTEVAFLIVDTLLGLAAVGYMTITANSWLRLASKRNYRGRGDDPEAREMQTFVSPGAPEGRPLLSDEQQSLVSVSEMAPKPGKQDEASLLGAQAVVQIVGAKRVHFQTQECDFTEEHRPAQRTQHENKYMFADGSKNKDRVVQSSLRANGIVRSVKPSDTVVKTVFGFSEQVGNGVTNNITVNGNETKRQCFAQDCDYWPSKESIFPSSKSTFNSESCTNSSSKRMYHDTGSFLRHEEIHAKRHIHDMSEYTVKKKRNVCTPNSYAKMSEVRGQLLPCAASSQETKFPSNAGLKSPNTCRCKAYYMECLRARVSFITTDRYAHSINSLGVTRDMEVSTINGRLMCQKIKPTSKEPSSLRARPPGSKRPGNIWMYATPELTKRSLLSGGRGLGYVHSASDMDLTVFAPKGCVYQCSSVTIGSSATDSGGVVLHRMFTPRKDLMKSNSWECSISDMGPNKFLCWIPALSRPSISGQSGSSLSQTTLQSLEECIPQKVPVTRYNHLVPIGASLDWVYNANNEMKYSSSSYERVRDSLEQQGKKTASDPCVDNLGRYLVDNVRSIANSFALNNLKLSEYWCARET